MEPEKEKPTDSENEAPVEEVSSPDAQDAPADALSRTPEELEQEQAESADPDAPAEEPVKKLPFFKRVFRKVNIYFLIFAVIIVVAAAITIVNYINSQRAPEEPNIATQQLSEDTLKQLANTDATVGGASQTLTIQGNAIIAGQTLMRGNLNVAGNLQTGGSLQAPTITISGSANLGDTQINTLQVASDTAVQGNTTLRDLNVSGASSFSGAMTASQITVTRLILSGNAILEVPNHISFTGPTPTFVTNNGPLGTGGSVSMSGSDTAGTVNINTGNSPTPGCLVRITFREAFANQPRVVISPVGAAGGQMQYYVERNATSFSICSANSTPANQGFSFDYFITN